MMDGNLNNKVYINPNFKRPLINTWPFVYPNITNLHKCFPQQMQNDKLCIKKNSNRRIYVNPNFKQVKQEKESYSTARERHEKDENIDAYPKLISKSKYSLVTNINKSKVDEINTIEEKSYNHSMNTMHKADIFYNQNICTQKVLNDKYQKGDPIIKSRYSIVRKNKVLSEDKREIKPINLKEGLTDTVQKFLSRSSNLNTCYSNFNNSSLKNQENKRSGSKPLPNIAKIKISKYKTVPITYIKKNISSIKAKSNSSTQTQFHTNTEKSNRVEFPFNNNRYKLTRCSSKPIVSIANPSKIQIVNKSVWNNQSKIKLLKANFKVNNVPCRLFTKYGKCLRKDYGKCEYLHDKKHVSLCRKFLKGICHDINCPLSHELTANKMPTCFFYLKGICTKEKCPYLHIKLNEKTKICHNFTEGYCANGDTCKFRHVKLNQSKKGKFYNSLNSLQNKSTKLKKGTIKNVVQKKNITSLSDKKSIKSQNKEQSNIDCRYYKEMVTYEGTCKNIKPTRCKIGTLPSFIQL